VADSPARAASDRKSRAHHARSGHRQQAASIGADLVRQTWAASPFAKSSPTDPVTELNLAVERAMRALAWHSPGPRSRREGASSGRSPVGWITRSVDGTVNLWGFQSSQSPAATLRGSRGGRRGRRLACGGVRASVGTGARRDGAGCVPSSVVELGQALVAAGFDYSSEAAGQEPIYIREVPLPAAATSAASAPPPCISAGSPVAGSTPTTSATASAGTTPPACIAEEAGATVVRPSPDNGDRCWPPARASSAALACDLNRGPGRAGGSVLGAWPSCAHPARVAQAPP
jgi:hypothetical protein